MGVKHAFLLKRSIDARKKNDVHFVANALICDDSDFQERQLNRSALEFCKSRTNKRAPELNRSALDKSTLGKNISKLEKLNSIIPHEIIPFEKREKLAISASQFSAAQIDEEARPVIVGAGPAGLFAALDLAEQGFCPLLIERGAPVEIRKKDVETYIKTCKLNTESNVQFGEGGAGTFSDGKLTTGKNSPLVRQILENFVAAGAPTEILWQAKPHIGTDVLAGVVKAIRQRIIACGGQVRFFSQLVGLEVEKGHLQAILVRERRDTAGSSANTGANNMGSASHVNAAAKTGANANANATKIKEMRIACKNLILACGHSARDTFAMLQKCGIKMEPKSFSMGLRIEHLQKDINAAQYGRFAQHLALKAADYKLNCKTDAGRGVYTFCMCPGGSIVPASSEEGKLCVNGMSLQARNGINANAALLVDVRPQDFLDNKNNPLAGISFQRYWEEQAFNLGGSNWCAPVQYVGDFLTHSSYAVHSSRTAQSNRFKSSSTTSNRSLNTAKSGSKASKKVQPSYPLGVKETDLKKCLPDFVSAGLAQGIVNFGRRLKGFDSCGAILTGIEARSSSPVKILRNKETLEAENIAGLYPCGEGCGYAGGIMSAAMDGIRCARALMQKYSQDMHI